MGRRALDVWWQRHWRELAVGGILALIPLGVLVVDIDAGALSGCGSYGYACSEPACVAVEISKNYGYTWQKGSAWVYGSPGSQIDLYIRTTLTTTVGNVQGWSFGVEHSAPTLEGSGGSLSVSAAASGPGVQTVKAGAPADFVSTRPWTCGFTQGLAIDLGGAGVTLGPTTNLVTAIACYRLKFPSGYSVHTVKLEFTGGVGAPPVGNVVTREGQSIAPCKESLTLYVQPTYYNPTPSYCPLSAMYVDPCGEGEGAGAGGEGAEEGGCGAMTPFVRGDSNADGSLDIADPVSLLNYLFDSGAEPTCLQSADVDDSDAVDISDPINLLGYLFLGGPAPVGPYPLCGVGSLRRSTLSCESYSLCPAVPAIPNLSQRRGYESETAVAVNPLDPENVVVISIRSEFTGNPQDPPYEGDWKGLFRAVTCDGGTTWSAGEILAEPPGKAEWDPAAAFDGFGNLFVVYGSEEGTAVAASTDGGVTFPTDRRKLVGWGDRPDVATGPSPVTPGDQAVWIAVRTPDFRVRVYGAPVAGVVQSMSNGAGEPELALSFTEYTVAEAAWYCHYPQLAVGPQGEVMVAYQNGAHPYEPTRPVEVFVRLRPAGDLSIPFGDPILVATGNVCGLVADDIGRDYIPARPEGPPDTKGVSADPDLAWDRGRFGAGPRVYLAYLDKPSPDELGNENHDTDVHLLVNDSPLDDTPGNHSWVPWNWTDGRVNTDAPGASQFFHRIAVDQETGHVAISWYDARPPNGEPLDLTKVRFFATHTSSLDPLTFVPEFPVLADEEPSDGTPLPGASQAQAQGTLGDYTGIDFGGGVFYPAWANNSGAHGNPEPRKADLFTNPVTVVAP